MALIARSREALEGVAAEIREAGGTPLVLPADVADAAAVDLCADAVVEGWGGIDAWVNNAMVTVFSSVGDMTADQYRRVTAVDNLGTVHGTLSALRHMREAGHGVIVQVGSALAYRSIPLQSAYCGGVGGACLTDSLRCELLHDESPVKLTMLQLRAVNTPQFDVCRTKLGRRPQPLPPVYQPEVIARAVTYAIEHPRREIWIAPSTYQAILGQRVAPGLLDRYLSRAAYPGQITEETAPAEAPDNLERPLPGTGSTHGRFEDMSRGSSAQLWVRRHWRSLVAGALAVAGGALAVGRLARVRPDS